MMGRECRYTSLAQSSKFKVQKYQRFREIWSDREYVSELQDIGKSLRCESVVLDSEVVGLSPETGAFIRFRRR